MGPVLKWPGSKWRLAGRIAATLPQHTVYLEPYFGSGAVFFTKGRSRLETINDADGRVCNLFRVLRERPEELARVVALTPFAREELRAVAGALDCGDDVERARRFVVLCWQQIGRRTGTQGTNGWRWTKDAGSTAIPQWLDLPERIAVAAERLREAQIECRPALEVIASHRSREVLIYADPPYPMGTLSTHARSLYREGMTDGDHLALLATLDVHPGPVVLSGYGCPLYDDRLGHWHREEIAATAEGGRARTEVLWRNARAAVPSLFD